MSGSVNLADVGARLNILLSAGGDPMDAICQIIKEYPGASENDLITAARTNVEELKLDLAEVEARASA